VPLLGFATDQTLATAVALTPWQWVLMLHLAVIGSIISLQLWSYGMKHIPSAEAAAFIYAVPLISVLAGVLLLGEPVTLGLIVGGSLFLAGVALAQFTRG
jgi:drug/metabolite transporter (DMT)-like permease